MLTLLHDDHDREQNKEFELLFFELQCDQSLNHKNRRELIERLERSILTQKMHPSTRQKARFWYYVAQVNLAEQRSHAAFEALRLCEKNLPSDDTKAALQLHMSLAGVALDQGHYSQSLLSTIIAATSLQQLLPMLLYDLPPTAYLPSDLHFEVPNTSLTQIE